MVAPMSLECNAATSGLGPDRRTADLLQQEIDEDPDFRGQDIRFRVDEPQGGLIVDPVVGQDTDQ